MSENNNFKFATVDSLSKRFRGTDIVARIVETTDAKKLDVNVLDRDAEESVCVEVNFRNITARIVETSSAPVLTPEVMRTLGKPIKTVEMFYESDFWQVSVRDGVPSELQILSLKLQSGETAEQTEMMYRLLSEMFVDPVFTYGGTGDGIPIEARSDAMISALMSAFSAVNFPEEDLLFQVRVRRRVPDGLIEELRSLGIGDTREDERRYVDLSDSELVEEMETNRLHRHFVLPQVIVEPKLICYPLDEQGEQNREKDIEYDQETGGYPVEMLSERFLQTLNMAFKMVVLPESGIYSLRREGAETSEVGEAREANGSRARMGAMAETHSTSPTSAKEV